MRKTIAMTIGGLLAVALMMGALYAWFNVADKALATDRPQTMVWASRLMAIGLGALAQVVVLWLVAGRVYANRPMNKGFRVIASCVGCIALIAAAALGLAARG